MGEAIALGLVQGPAEILPISSSGHLEAVPWLLGWRTAELPGQERKALAVALHAGTAAALVVGLGREVLPLAPLRMAAAVAPPALAGLAFETTINARLGTPASLAAGLVAGSIALVLADRAPRTRRRADARVTDGLWLGLAQASALVPGVSRSAATLAAARARGFARPDAARLSLEAALPVLVAAAVRTRPRAEPALLAGAAASFLAGLASRRLWRIVAADRPLAPWALYRCALAGAILAVRHHRGP